MPGRAPPGVGPFGEKRFHSPRDLYPTPGDFTRGSFDATCLQSVFHHLETVTRHGEQVLNHLACHASTMVSRSAESGTLL